MIRFNFSAAYIIHWLIKQPIIRQEKDRALTVREEQEKECATLRERLETLHNSWEKMKGELEEGRGSRRVFEAERIRDGLLGENDG